MCMCTLHSLHRGQVNLNLSMCDDPLPSTRQAKIMICVILVAGHGVLLEREIQVVIGILGVKFRKVESVRFCDRKTRLVLTHT